MLLIKDITVYDGTGKDGFTACILIEDDKIAAVKPGLNLPGVPVIEGRNLAAAPGFIDIHSHSEFSLLSEPAAPSKIMQGITTDVSGNCGMSAAPMLDDAAKAREKELESYAVTRTWEDFEGYFEALGAARPALNFATFCGHGNLRASVMGYADRAPEGPELARMKELLEAAMTAGALGLSTGLIYPPGVYCVTDELISLAKVAARYGGVYTSHMRSEGPNVIEAIEEAVRVGWEGGLPVQISHLKTGGQANWAKLPAIIDTIERARSSHVDVTADRYPYTAGATGLDAILPAWCYEGGNAEEIKRLTDPATRARIKEEVLRNHPDPDHWIKVMISSVESDPLKKLEGKTLAAAADALGRDPVDALFDILIEDGCRTEAIYFSMSEDNLRTLLAQDWMMIGSDSTARGMAGPTAQGKPHPRGFGSFPRVLGRYAREEKILTLPQAVRKMAGMQADRLGLAGRGYIKEGAFADIVVFDPKKVIDTATYEAPYSYPEGIRHVFVNGEHAVKDGAQTDARAGRVLRKT